MEHVLDQKQRIYTFDQQILSSVPTLQNGFAIRLRMETFRKSRLDFVWKLRRPGLRMAP
jgi:hypothetical protein